MKFQSSLFSALIFSLSIESAYSTEKRGRSEGTDFLGPIFDRITRQKADDTPTDQAALTVSLAASLAVSLADEKQRLPAPEASGQFPDSNKLALPLVFNHLDIADFIRASGVCRCWRGVATTKFSLTEDALLNLLCTEGLFTEKDTDGRILHAFMNRFLKDKQGFLTLNTLFWSLFEKVDPWDRKYTHKRFEISLSRGKAPHSFHLNPEISKAYEKAFFLGRLFYAPKFMQVDYPDFMPTPIETPAVPVWDWHPNLRGYAAPQLFPTYARFVIANLSSLTPLSDPRMASQQRDSVMDHYALFLWDTLPGSEALDAETQWEDHLVTARFLLKCYGSTASEEKYNRLGVVFHNAAMRVATQKEKEQLLRESAFYYDNAHRELNFESEDDRNDRAQVARMLLERFSELSNLTEDISEKVDFLKKSKRYGLTLLSLPRSEYSPQGATEDDKILVENISQEVGRRLSEIEEKRRQKGLVSLEFEEVYSEGNRLLREGVQATEPTEKYRAFITASQQFNKVLGSHKNLTPEQSLALYKLIGRSLVLACDVESSFGDLATQYTSLANLAWARCYEVFSLRNTHPLTLEDYDWMGWSMYHKGETSQSDQDKEGNYKSALTFLLKAGSSHEVNFKIAQTNFKLFQLSKDPAMKRAYCLETARRSCGESLVDHYDYSIIHRAADALTTVGLHDPEAFVIAQKDGHRLWNTLLGAMDDEVNKDSGCKHYLHAAAFGKYQLIMHPDAHLPSEFEPYSTSCSIVGNLFDELLSMEEYQSKVAFKAASQIQWQLFKFMDPDAGNDLTDIPGTRLEYITRCAEFSTQALERFPDQVELMDYRQAIHCVRYMALTQTNEELTLLGLEKAAQWVDKALVFLKDHPQQNAESLDPFYENASRVFDCASEIEKDPLKRELIGLRKAKLDAIYSEMKSQNQDHEQGG